MPRNPLPTARLIATAFANAQAGRPHTEQQARAYALDAFVAKQNLLGPNGTTQAQVEEFCDLVVKLLPMPGMARRVSGRSGIIVRLFSPTEGQKRLPLGGGQRGPWMVLRLNSGIEVQVPVECPEEAG